MWKTYLGFVFLIWFPGELHAQSAAQPCSRPTLDGGYFVPVQISYSHERSLSYSCDDEHKPAAEGWWATSTCQNGTWSPKPQCIDKNNCITPTIPNVNYTGITNEWYKNGKIIRVKCDNGYELKNQAATASCINGTWSSLPICEKSVHTCGEPPKVPHAVIIHQEYQELFAVDSKVQYECEDGYTIEGGDTKKSIICLSGTWTEGPTCRKGPGTKHDGSADGGTGGGHTTSAGSGTPAASGGSSTTSDSGPLITPIDRCGAPPNVPNGDVLQRDRMHLKYQCNAFYQLHGLDTVVCYSDGTWSTPPICKDAFCVLDPAQYTDFKQTGVEYIKEGDSKYVPCLWEDYLARVQCTNGKLTIIRRCCHRYHIESIYC